MTEVTSCPTNSCLSPNTVKWKLKTSLYGNDEHYPRRVCYFGVDTQSFIYIYLLAKY